MAAIATQAKQYSNYFTAYTLCGHKCQSIAVLNVRHDGNISVVSAQHFLQLCENLGILYQKLLHIINVTLTKSLGLDLR